MPKHRLFEFETVSQSEIPKSTWGANFWEKPTMVLFLGQLTGLLGGKALKLSYPTKPELLNAHMVLRHRIERATKLGFLTDKYVITGRYNPPDFNLYIYKDGGS